jgi:chorismate mutase/prephenate dehydratase
MTKVAYLGIPGSYSYAAAEALFEGQEASFEGMASFRDIFEAISHDEADYGAIPIENTLAGSIYDNYDLLDTHKLNVVGEYYLQVSHCLLGVKGASVEHIRRVHSHQKALEQCTNFFKEHPEIEQFPVSDTAAAAKLVAEQNDPTVAAIASAQAGDMYDLEVLKRKLEDNPHNVTLFLLISKHDDAPKDADKCSVILRVPHKPGSLYKTFGILANNGCNVTKIESRPMVGKPFEYIFYLDFQYNAATAISDILAELRKIALEIKPLGLYKHRA